MSVEINGMKKLDVNVFDEITVSQISANDYVVDVIGDSISTTYDKFSRELDSMNSEEVIIAIIERYLDNFKINGITSLIELSCKDGKWVVVSGCGSSKKLRLQLFNSKFNNIVNYIMKKYLNDRYDYCWNEDIKLVRFLLDSEHSKYYSYDMWCDECEIEEYCSNASKKCYEKYVEFSMKLGKYGILEFEKKFIREFLHYKFDQVGDEVRIINNYFDSSHHILKGYIIECGDFRVCFSPDDNFKFIFDIIDNYNKELFERKENVKRKQLKMEEF